MAGLSEAEKLNGIVTGVKDHYNEIVKNESASGGESIKPFCVDGAIMQCTMGSAPGNLTVIDHGVTITGKYAAHDEDRVPGTNIPSFGTCAATGKPCAPSPVPKWLLTDEFSLMTNKRGAAATSAENCALITDSILVCMQGGIIKFVTSGQMMTVGDLLEMLKALFVAMQRENSDKHPANTGNFKDDTIDVFKTIEAYLEKFVDSAYDLRRQLFVTKDEGLTHYIVNANTPLPANCIDENGLIIDQNKLNSATNDQLENPIMYGNNEAYVSACGPIAVYNILKTFGRERYFDTILHYFEMQPLQATKNGAHYRFAVGHYLEKYCNCDVTYIKKREEIIQHASEYDACCILYKGNLTSNNAEISHFISFFPVEGQPGMYHFYNDNGKANDIRTLEEFFDTYEGKQYFLGITDKLKS